MPEDARKRRLRKRKRKITKKLKDQGYEIFEMFSGPFDLYAGKGRRARYIRITFGASTTDDINAVRLASLPGRCEREIWQISESGYRTIVCRVAGNGEKVVKE